MKTMKSRKRKQRKEEEADTFEIVSDDPRVIRTTSTDRVTLPKLTRFERAVILGVRCKQLAGGSMPLLAAADMPMGAVAARDEAIVNPLPTASLEIKRRLLPVIVRRHLTDGSREDWRFAGAASGVTNKQKESAVCGAPVYNAFFLRVGALARGATRGIRTLEGVIFTPLSS